MTTIHSLTLSRALFALLLGLCSVLSQAANVEPIDESVVDLKPQQQNGISYLSGGIGIDETQAIQQEKGYNLHMTFSAGPSNEYVPNIDVVIQTLKGQVVVSMKQIGPIAFVKLPADTYLIISSRDGHEKRQTIAVGSGAVQTVNVHWGDEP